MGFFEDLKRRIADVRRPGSNEVKKDVLEENDDSTSDEQEILQVFDGPLKRFPSNRSEVYEMYGRAPKDSNPAHKKWPRAKMMIAKNLPGNWNHESHRLYVLAFIEPYLREALSRCEMLNVLNAINTLGCYNHRNIRHRKNGPLSYHSWGAAVDINSRQNKALHRSRKQLAPPFSKQYLDVYPNHIPFKLVRAFKSVGFSWGGDWGHDDWLVLVDDEGIGWDADKIKWPSDWKDVSYYDPMHFELISRK